MGSVPFFLVCQNSFAFVAFLGLSAGVLARLLVGGCEGNTSIVNLMRRYHTRVKRLGFVPYILLLLVVSAISLLGPFYVFRLALFCKVELVAYFLSFGVAMKAARKL